MKTKVIKSLGKPVIIAVLCICVIFQFVCGCSNNETGQTKNHERQITDMAGRTVTIPAKIDKVFPASPPGLSMIYSLAPEKLAGWNFKLTDGMKEFIDPKSYDLPVLGFWAGAAVTANVEEIIKQDPDLIIYMTDTNGEAFIEQANDVQERTGIPVVVLDYSIEATDKVYKILGDYLGEEERAGELADYCRKNINSVKKQAAEIPEDERVSVYYALGIDGLQTDPKGSLHMEALELVKGENVAVLPEEKGSQVVSTTSLEQVVAWSPDVILVNTAMGDGFYSSVFKDSRWADIKAVKDKKVYLVPCNPFNWFDRPPCMCRVLGIEWLGNLLYPEYIKLDINKEVKNFFALFYRYNLTDDQVAKLLKGAAAR